MVYLWQYINEIKCLCVQHNCSQLWQWLIEEKIDIRNWNKRNLVMTLHIMSKTLLFWLTRAERLYLHEATTDSVNSRINEFNIHDKTFQFDQFLRFKSFKLFRIIIKSITYSYQLLNNMYKSPQAICNKAEQLFLRL